MLRYFNVYALLFRNSLIREMSFKANFLLWTFVEVLWFLGQVLFIDVLFSHIDTLGNWTKWQVERWLGRIRSLHRFFRPFFI